MNIIEAINDEALFRPYLADADGGLASWQVWQAGLRAIYGLPMPDAASREAIKATTGRDAALLPPNGFRQALLLTGRRSGKSRISAIIGGYEAVLAGHERKLAKGERGVVAICAPTKHQGRIVRDYLRALFDTEVLRNEVSKETPEGFDLANGHRIEIMAGDFRTIRGYTLIACIVDEVCFFGYDSDSKIRSDSELIRAVRPALSTVKGRLVAISSPYAPRGWAYEQWKKHYGNDAGRVLVLNAPSRTLNPTLDQAEVDEAMAEDPAAARAEFMGQWRDEIAAYLPRSVVEALTVPGRIELLPDEGTRYVAFADLSGGRSDDAALAIAHRKGRLVVLDKLCRYRPPFNPHEVIGQMATEVRRWGCRKVTGDNYAAEFVAKAFEAAGIRYAKAEQPKAQLYTELLPRMCSGEIELLDDVALVDQIANLERRTRSGGRDIIDHPPGGHDDLANAVAGAAVCAAVKPIKVGAF